MKADTRPELAAFERAMAGNVPARPPAVVHRGALTGATLPMNPETGETFENPFPAWLWNEFLDGLTVLWTLRLQNAPAEDSLEMVVGSWITACSFGRTFQEKLDRARIRHGFRLLAGTVERWPAPAQFLACLPPPVDPPPAPSAPRTWDDPAPWPAYCPGVAMARVRTTVEMMLRQDRAAELAQRQEDMRQANAICYEIEARDRAAVIAGETPPRPSRGKRKPRTS